jgi:hypothetical protein
MLTALNRHWQEVAGSKVQEGRSMRKAAQSMTKVVAERSLLPFLRLLEEDLKA